MRHPAAHLGHYRADAAHDGYVVVFDENARAEIVAVIAPTPGADGVLVERAKARRGLASVGDARSFRAGGLDECPGQGGDSGKVLNEVECRAFGGQDGERATRDAGYLGAGGKPLPILGQLRHRERVIDAGEDRRTDAKAGQDQGSRATSRAEAIAVAQSLPAR